MTQPFMKSATVYGILDDRRQRQANDAAVSGNRDDVLSGTELFEKTQSIGRVLKNLGVQKDHRVAIVLPNGPGMAVAFLGVAAHAVAAPLNPGYQRDEFRYYLGDLAVKAVICPATGNEALISAVGELGIPLLRVAEARGGSFEFVEADESGESTLDSADPDDVALVLHTSGTTSRPKQVPLTHRNLCASADNIARALELSKADRCLNIMPLFHIHGLVGTLLASLASGGTIVCAEGLDGETFLSALGEYEPTWYSAVPTMHQRVIALARTRGNHSLDTSLRFIRSSSAALPPKVMKELEELFQVPVIESYGMTEAAHQMCSNPLPPRERKPGTVGLPAGPEVAIMDGGGAILRPGDTGEIVIRGENVTAGYVNNPEANRTGFTDGWFRTGDLGSVDEEGYLSITGRIKEMINRGGEKIAPREIDELLLEHPAVEQAIAFSIPHQTLGEDVVAAVVPVEGSPVTGEEVRNFAFERLAGFKVPSRIVIMDEIPKGPTGKIQRTKLHEQLKNELVPNRQPLQSDTELALGEIWAELLDATSLGGNDNFFLLGGDSLIAIRLVARIRDRFSVEVPPSDIFRYPELHPMAGHLDALLKACSVSAGEQDLEALATSVSEEELAKLIEEVINEDAPLRPEA